MDRRKGVNPRETIERYEAARKRQAMRSNRGGGKRGRNRGLVWSKHIMRGLLPVALGLGATRHYLRYFFRRHFASTFSRCVLGGMAFLTAGAVVLAGFLLNADNALEVLVDGETIGFVVRDGDISAESLLEQVSNTLAVTVGANVVLEQGISLQPLRASQDEIMTRPEMVSALRDKLAFTVEGFVIMVDGVDMGVLRSQEAAQDLLQNLLNQHVGEGVQMAFTPEFVESVDIEGRNLEPGQLELPDTVFARLHQSRATQQQHYVTSGESLSLIASRYDMTLEQLRAANPEATDVLSVGQRLNVIHNTPLLSIRTVEVHTNIEPEPFRVETIENEAQLNTFRRVIQEGVEGVKEVVIHVTRVNGVEEGRARISENVIEPPIHEIVEVGTMEHPHLIG